MGRVSWFRLITEGHFHEFFSNKTRKPPTRPNGIQGQVVDILILESTSLSVLSYLWLLVSVYMYLAPSADHMAPGRRRYLKSYPRLIIINLHILFNPPQWPIVRRRSYSRLSLKKKYFFRQNRKIFSIG